MALDKQIHIYSVDTGAFYTRKESQLHWKLHKYRYEKEKVKKNINELEYKLATYSILEGEMKEFLDTENSHDFTQEEYCLITMWISLRNYYLEIKDYKSQKIKETKDKLLEVLKERAERNSNPSSRFIRKLNNKQIIDKNVISVFESALTRILNLKINQLTDDIIIVKTFYFDIIKDLVLNGFEYNGEHYKYFTSSAGQIRTKKTVFIKQSLLG